MPAGKLDVILAEPPLESWTELCLQSPLTGFYALRLPYLERLACRGGSSMAFLPYEQVPRLSSLDVTGNAFAALELWRLPNLVSCLADQNEPLTSVDAHGLAGLAELSVGDCPRLSWVNVADCPNLLSLWLSWCALTSEAVDQILADMVATGPAAGWNGWINLGYGDNQPPSSAGQVNKTILANRGWTVVTM